VERKTEVYNAFPLLKLPVSKTACLRNSGLDVMKEKRKKKTKVKDRYAGESTIIDASGPSLLFF
jgi:hypothetical protein